MKLGRNARSLPVYALMALLVMILAGESLARKTRATNRLPKIESYTRPKPTRPIKPELPSENRYQSDKVFLEKADSLYSIPTFDKQERQIVKGNVKFRHGGLFMYCDSAYYYPDNNSMDAFGHVKMEQGDTLFAYADVLYYTGENRHARLLCGPTERKVRLINRDVKLTTDSLDYDLTTDIGSYEYGGEIDDKTNILTSWRGYYSTATKDAEFYDEVVLVNNEDGYRVLSDTLYYNTNTKIATIVSPTEIQSENDTIVTSSGYYNTQTGNAELTSRSLIMHRDSVGNVTTLEGDSIVYDKQTRISRTYMFTGPDAMGRPMVLTDTANKVTLIGGYGEYNDSTRESLATIYPLLIEYSRPDSLFLRADTIRTVIKRILLNPIDPVADNISKSDQPAYNESDNAINSLPNDSTSSELPSIIGEVCDSLESKEIVVDSISIAPPIQHIPKPEQEITSEVLQTSMDTVKPVYKDFHEAYAYPRARFFRKDIQGIADTLVYMEQDSMMYMRRKPVLWADTRQAYGNIIDIHFNDTTADYALFPDNGMIGEHVDEDFYNQLSSRKMVIQFENGEMSHLDADGNVQAILLPMENDSTYNKLVNAESSFMSVDVSDGEMDKMKMWPDVSGHVVPIFMVKQNQKLLNGFQWYEALRPKREWYEDADGILRLQWADDLGELPEELEMYFSTDNEPLGRRSRN